MRFLRELLFVLFLFNFENSLRLVNTGLIEMSIDIRSDGLR